MFIEISPIDERKAAHGRFAMFKRTDGQYLIVNTVRSLPFDPFTGNTQESQRLGPVSKPVNKSIVTRECDRCQTSARSDALITHCAECGDPYV